MITILLIADQDRLGKLFDFTKEYPQIQFRIAHSLHQGLQDIASDTPSILFIQNHLSGLSGEIIVRHVMAGMAEDRPKVVILGGTGNSLNMPGLITDCLDLSLTDEELTGAIIGIITGSSSETTAGSQTTPDSPEQAQAGQHTVPSSSATTPEPVDKLPETEEYVATATASDVVEEQPATESAFGQKLQAVIETAASPVPLAELEERVDVESAKPPSMEESRFARESSLHREMRGTKKTRVWIASGVALLLTAGGAFLLSGKAEKKQQPARASLKLGEKASLSSSTEKGGKPAPSASAQPALPQPAIKPATPLPALQPATPPPPQPSPANPPAKPSTALRKLTVLPAFIPKQGLDKEYGKDHPGWKRYKGARTEFKVYSENADIRAIQAIDRSGIGIPESFLGGVLQQVAQTRNYAVDEKGQKENFYIEKGKVTADTRLVIYRKARGGAIKAFVIYFQ